MRLNEGENIILKPMSHLEYIHTIKLGTGTHFSIFILQINMTEMEHRLMTINMV